MDHDDEPAFPTRAEEYREASDGLTKREHIAIAAMQGLLASGDATALEPAEVASDAVNLADALLERLVR